MLSKPLQMRLVASGAMAVWCAVGQAQTATAAGEAQSAGTVAAAAAVAQTPTQADAPSETSAVSQVRIVRLSLVRGVVQMDRNTGRGFEMAFANIPVVAGARLRTGEGVAEIELEDNSSMRLAPNSEVQFERLGRTAAGTTLTTVKVGEGTVYVALEKTKGNEFALISPDTRLELQPGAHLRLALDKAQTELAVFEGETQLQVGSFLTTVGKKQTVVLSPGMQTVSSVTKGTQEKDWDQWDKQESSYHRQKASFAGTGGFGLYGANDLSYYGSFVDMPGCGSMWRPYFASAAWDPFASGVWTYYPSAGYSWVSPYPWGWLPFHSGTWASCGGAGWGWRPGGSWYGVNNLRMMHALGHPLPHPVPPAPVRSGSTLVPVNMKQIPVSGPSKGGEFAFRGDSAGLGVPRTAFGNLHAVASHVNQQGMTMRTMPSAGIITSAPAGGRQASGFANGNRGTAGVGASRSSGTSSSVSLPVSVGQSSSGISASAPSSGGMHSSAPAGASAHR